MSDADDLIDDMVIEAMEHVELIEPTLMNWEADLASCDDESVNLVFRYLHTIKGNFGFVGLKNIKSLAHAMENLLSQVRDGIRNVDAPLTALLIDGVDQLRKLLEEAASSDQVSIEELLSTLIASHQSCSSSQIDLDPDPLQAEEDEYDLLPDEGAFPQVDSPLARPTHDEWELSIQQCQGLCYLKFSYNDNLEDILTQLKDWGTTLRHEVSGSSCEVLFMTMVEEALLCEVLTLDSTSVVNLPCPSFEALSPTEKRQKKAKDDSSANNKSAEKRHVAEAIVEQILSQPDANRNDEQQHERDKDKNIESNLNNNAISPASQTPQLNPSALNPAENDITFSTSAPTSSEAPKSSPSSISANPPASKQAGEKTGSKFKTTSTHADMLRLPISLVDHLMSLVGELVLSRNKLNRLANNRILSGPLGELLRERYIDETHRLSDSEITAAPSLERLDHALSASMDNVPQVRQMLKEIDKVTRDLQGSIMQMRLQPVGKAFNKANRLVRQVARDLRKEINLEIIGEDTELDKGVIEAIADPLTHLLRNACDHGIESPEGREVLNKPRAGTITLAAAHEGDNATITITDDGNGINYRRILDKAVEKGLVREDEIDSISEAKALDYLFAPGLSTAQTVSEVSGRGVGMDVVRTNIERLGGSVSVTTELGKGSVFTVTIPLTLSIINGLLVSAGDKTFAISQSSLTEIVQVKPTIDSIEIVQFAHRYACNLRGSLIPLIDLPSLVSKEPLDHSACLDQGVATILVVECDGLLFGIVVDEIIDSEEVVVKRLSDHLASQGIYNGATILGDGEVALILDLPLLLQHSGLNDNRDFLHDLRVNTNSEEKNLDRCNLLLVESPDGGRQAIEINEVIRMDKITSLKLDTVGNHDVARYNNEVLPLMWASEVLPERRVGDRRVIVNREDKRQLVVILERAGRNFGLVVHRLIDLGEEEIQHQHPPSRDGVKQCLMIRERVTELLDIDRLITLADIEQFLGITEAST